MKNLRTVSRPASLSVPDFDVIGTAGGVLDVGDGLEHVVEVRVRGVFDGLGLPEGEAVGQAGDAVSKYISMA